MIYENSTDNNDVVYNKLAEYTCTMEAKNCYKNGKQTYVYFSY